MIDRTTDRTRPNKGAFVKIESTNTRANKSEQTDDLGSNTPEQQTEQDRTQNGTVTERPGVYVSLSFGERHTPRSGDARTCDGQANLKQIPVLTQHQKARLPSIFALLERFGHLEDARSMAHELHLLANDEGSSVAEVLAWGKLVAPQLIDNELEGRWLHAAVVKTFTSQPLTVKE